MIKSILLTVALVLPVAVYLFLQGFGNNVYDLPKLYQTDLPKNLAIECGAIKLPYRLNLEKYMQPSEYHKVLDIRMSGEENSFLENEFNRVNAYFVDKRFDRVIIGNASMSAIEQALIIEELESFVKCELLHSAEKSFMVLVDNEGYIRSYFDENDRADFDRLIVELEILREFK
jgi:hypothetical protein